MTPLFSPLGCREQRGENRGEHSLDPTTSCLACGLDGNVVRPFVSQSLLDGVSDVNLH